LGTQGVPTSTAGHNIGETGKVLEGCQNLWYTKGEKVVQLRLERREQKKKGGEINGEHPLVKGRGRTGVIAGKNREEEKTLRGKKRLKTLGGGGGGRFENAKERKRG